MKHSAYKIACICIVRVAGLVVGDPERLGGSDVPRGPHRDPLHGQQLRRLAHHGEGVHEGSDENQGGRLSGEITDMTAFLFFFPCLSHVEFAKRHDINKTCLSVLHETAAFIKKKSK